MRNLLLILLSFTLQADGQSNEPITQKGWLVYRYGEMIAFLPIKNQQKIPTYTNFLTEEKGDGQRMNANYSAPPKLLLAKLMSIKTYERDEVSQKDTLIGNFKYYIQPVRYTYKVDTLQKNPFDDLAGGWSFPINGKPTFHPVYHFLERWGEIYFLNKADSTFAKRGGRRKSIDIYPPH